MCHPTSNVKLSIHSKRGYTTPDQIDPTELTGCTRRALKIVNALLA
jgi:hypothetical protein